MTRHKTTYRYRSEAQSNCVSFNKQTDDCRLLRTRHRHRSAFGEQNGKRRSSALPIHMGPDPDRTAILIDELFAHP